MVRKAAAPEIRPLSSITHRQARFKITPGVIEAYLATVGRSLICRALEKAGGNEAAAAELWRKVRSSGFSLRSAAWRLNSKLGANEFVGCWASAGFFVFNRRVSDYLCGDDSVFEQHPLRQLAAYCQLRASQLWCSACRPLSRWLSRRPAMPLPWGNVPTLTATRGA